MFCGSILEDMSHLRGLHFLCECLKVIIETYWGNPSFTGSLCHLRGYINRLTVDKKANTFSIANEFVLHAFKAHIVASICEQLNIKSPTDSIAHDCTPKWLEMCMQTVE